MQNSKERYDTISTGYMKICNENSRLDTRVTELEDRIKAVLDDRANKMVKRLDTRSYQLEDEIYANTLEELACLIVDVDDRNMIDTKSIDRIFREDRRTFAYNHARSNGKARLIHLIETKYKKKRGGDTV